MPINDRLPPALRSHCLEYNGGVTHFADRQFIRELQQAYADKTEAFFQGLSTLPDNPFDVRIRCFGPARSLIARGHDWVSRATLTGDESHGLVDEIIRYFAEEGQRCLIEWNPGNCYRGGSWDDALGRHLLARGFTPAGFRCVWAAETTDRIDDRNNAEIEVQGYGADDLNRFLDETEQMHGYEESRLRESRFRVLAGEGDQRWRHYIGRFGGVPCCEATMFLGKGIAYLEWGGTIVGYRGRGCHSALIRARLADAADHGCELAFAVTDIGVPSARNLQRANFHLAYNYVMLSREPLPLD